MFARFALSITTAFVIDHALAEPVAVTITKGTAQTSAAGLTVQSKYKLAPTEFDAIRGAYTLSDGRWLKIWTERRKIFAEINSRSVEIVPEAKNTFISRDGAVELRFQPDAPDSTVTISEK